MNTQFADLATESVAALGGDADDFTGESATILDVPVKRVDKLKKGRDDGKRFDAKGGGKLVVRGDGKINISSDDGTCRSILSANVKKDPTATLEQLIKTPETNADNKPIIIIMATDYTYVGKVEEARPETRAYFIEFFELKDLMKFASVYMALALGSIMCNAPNSEQKDDEKAESSKAKAAVVGHTAGADDSSQVDSSNNDDDSFDSSSSDGSVEESQNVFAMNARRP